MERAQGCSADSPTRSESSSAKSASVLSIECLKGSSKADEWTGDMLQTGDIVEELRIGTSITVKSPFKNGRSGVQKILHSSFRAKDTSILVRVRRGRDEFAELQACIVPNDSAGRKQYMLRSIDDPNYAVGFLDRTELDCFDLQGFHSFSFLFGNRYFRWNKFNFFLDFNSWKIVILRKFYSLTLNLCFSGHFVIVLLFIA